MAGAALDGVGTAATGRRNHGVAVAPRLVAIGAFLGSCFLRPDIALGLVVLGVLFTVAERLRPLNPKPDAVTRQGAATDACHFVVDEILAAAGLTAVLVVVMPIVAMAVPDVVPSFIQSQPTWLTWAESLLAAEVAGYWGHRLTHQVPFLWRFHRVHHSSPTMDWLAPSRRHPVDQVFSRTSVAIPILAMGFAVPTIIMHFAIKRFQGLLVHANVNVRFGPLEWFVASPHFHHWHHSADPTTWDKNFAGQLPLVDWAFGTLYRPDHWPAGYGCDGWVPDEGYVAQVLNPWHPGRDGRSDPERIDLDTKTTGRSGDSGQGIAEHLVIRGSETPRSLERALDHDTRRLAQIRHERWGRLT